ncbi:rhodanese-like domain-containing protein [Natronococcus sp. A-GB7]|uniref:sulfurtransferase n=1 Tax=Natronococcus sp. A-GB7 TaxID=3037649 RepID=UPI00241DADB1|nr:rhodanese-like domain-containing protein [Natronococcus sp. A-GB7]MDG5821240.1 rhodanese-like domain-containing protein [Natronococcus sp. A-GB7]
MNTGSTTRRAVLRTASVAATAAIAGCLGTLREDDPENYTTPAAAEFDDVVDSSWLEDNLESVKLLDVRDESEFTEGHVAGAHRLPDTELMRNHYEETDDGYEASPEVIAEIAADAGIEPDDDVVVYGEGSNLWETYAIYTLRAIGHDGTVALLDGGYTVWEAADGAIETGTPDAESARYEPELDTNVVATRARVAERVHEDGADVQLVDNRTPEEYRGEDDDDRVTRHGHITGAINVDFPQNLVDDGARLRSPEELERLWLEDAGLDPGEETISYCTTAVRGSVGWFVMEQLGWEECRNYEGSWLDWGLLTEDDGYYYSSCADSGTVVDTFAD